MTKEFDDRNLAKSRAVCERMAEGAASARGMTERERRILDMWPKFADGEYVWFGDELVHKDQGHRFTVEIIELKDDGWRACAQRNAIRDAFRPRELVERPAKIVNDGDGVEIKRGDTVWCKGEPVEYTVMELGDGFVKVSYTASDGIERFLAARADALTHVRPDSWERLEQEAKYSPFRYCRTVGIHLDRIDCVLADQIKDTDIIRRAKALAGVSDED